MTGCHYKKCLQAPHLFSQPRCNPLLAFREAAIPPWSCSHGKGALLHTDPLAHAQLGRQSFYVIQPALPQLAFTEQCFSQQNKKQQQQICLDPFFVNQHTNKQMNLVLYNRKEKPTFPSSHKKKRSVTPVTHAAYCIMHTLP